MRAAGNTGVKGVLADHAEFQQQARIQAEMKRLETQRLLQRLAVTVRNDTPTEREEIDKEDERERLQAEEEVALDLDDDSYFEAYRAQHLQKIQAAHM